MGLSWQQGLLALGAVGRFLVPEPLHEPGQSVIPHGVDRDLTLDEFVPGRQP